MVPEWSKIQILINVTAGFYMTNYVRTRGIELQYYR